MSEWQDPPNEYDGDQGCPHEHMSKEDLWRAFARDIGSPYRAVPWEAAKAIISTAALTGKWWIIPIVSPQSFQLFKDIQMFYEDAPKDDLVVIGATEAEASDHPNAVALANVKHLSVGSFSELMGRAITGNPDRGDKSILRVVFTDDCPWSCATRFAGTFLIPVGIQMVVT